MNNDNRTKDERDLDRMLDLVAPPPPSEILRARLLRDFAPGIAGAVAATATLSGALRARLGALAVAAALVLAVALGVGIPPRAPAPPVAVATLAAPESDADALAAAYDSRFDEEVDEESLQAAYAEESPDSAAFMVAALDIAQGADAASEGADPFEGLPLD